MRLDNIRNLKLITIIFILGTAFTLRGGDPPIFLLSTLSGKIEAVDVAAHSVVYVDSSGKKGLSDIDVSQFEPLTSQKFPHGFLRNNRFRTWVHLRTSGRVEATDTLYWFLGREHADIRSFCKKQGQVREILWGRNNPGDRVLSAFLIPLDVDSGDTVDWYFCIKSFPYLHRPITPKIYSRQGWFAQNAQYLHDHRLPFNALIGLGSVLGFMLIFSLVQFVIHRAPVYAFYALFLCSVMLNLYRTNLEILIPVNDFNAYLVHHGNKLSTYLGHFFYFWFVIYFLDLPKTMPDLYRLVRTASFAALMLLGFHLLLYYAFGRHDWASVLYYLSRYALLAIVAACIVMVYLRKPPFYRFIIWGSLIVALGANWWMICGIRDSMGLLSPPYPNVVFYFCVLVETIIFVTGLGYKFRVTEEEKRKAQEKLLLERERISRDLHDDIGGTLNSLALLSNLAQKQATAGSAPTEVLHQIHSISKETIERMSDIVWAINPKRETLDQVLSRMRDFSQRLFGGSEVRVRFKSDERIESLNLSEENRWNLFLIFKEAMTNIQKHAHATQININFNQQKNALLLTIRDNGQGFDSSSNASGNGLRTMQERTRIIGGTLTLDTIPGSGTTITISIPTP